MNSMDTHLKKPQVLSKLEYNSALNTIQIREAAFGRQTKNSWKTNEELIVTHGIRHAKGNLKDEAGLS
eukprot:3309240-Amphidinium_carterae.1